MQRIEAKGPEHFLQVLLEALEGGYADAVVFRGERDIHPHVLPSGLRSKDGDDDDPVIGYFADSYIHVHGGVMQTPSGSSLRVEDVWSNLFVDATPSMPSVYLYALAQHHGLRTRLLDVTRNPLVAAYFAVDYRHAHETGDHVRVLVVGGRGRALSACQVVSVPPSANPRLLRQSGAFLRSNDWDHRVASSLEKLEPDSCREVTLPVFWVDRLRLMLQRMGISAATMYGDLDAVAAEARWRAKVEHLMLADPPESDDRPEALD